MARVTLVAVIGTSTATPEEAARAEAVGRLCAQRGWIVLTGGLGGVMEAASRGTRDAGGLVAGILPGRNPAEANPYVTIPIATGLGEARNAVIAHAAHGFVAIGRGYGTLSEIALALRNGKPVVGLGTWAVEGVIAAGSPEEAVEALAARLQPA